MMGGTPQMPQMSQMGSGMNGAARAPADPFAHSLSQPASAVSSPAPKGHKRVSSTATTRSTTSRLISFPWAWAPPGRNPTVVR